MLAVQYGVNVALFKSSSFFLSSVTASRGTRMRSVDSSDSLPPSLYNSFTFSLSTLHCIKKSKAERIEKE